MNTDPKHGQLRQTQIFRNLFLFTSSEQ